MTSSWIPPNTQREWERARHTAFVQDILSALTQQQVALLPFEQVRTSLRLHSARYLGLQDVPLDHIVGSVDRYQDFTRAFFPRQGIASQRWRRIAHLTSVIDGRLPPVDLYKVGSAYFVRDGNHRVSVARQNKMPSITAYVWEYDTPVALSPETTLDDLLPIAARAAFLERTHAEKFLCDDMHIELSQPSGYEDLLDEIEIFQHCLSRLDECEVPFGEAVALWCAMSYTPIIDIIRQCNVLSQFPGRTETDLYLWLCRNQAELETRYGQGVLMEQAVEDLAQRFGERLSPATQVIKTVGRVAESVGGLGSRLVKAAGSSGQTAEDEAVVAGLLASVRRVAAGTPPYRFQGTTRADWQAWRAGLRERVGEVLGAGDQPWVAYGATELQAEVTETTAVAETPAAAKKTAVDSLRRELIWLNTEPDLRVPAYLFRPRSVSESRPEAARWPVILILPGHGTIAQAAGLENSCQQANAMELARAGFVTLCLEPRGFGRLGAIDHLQLDGMARLVGRTWYGLLLQDARRAIDYLLTRPEVDPARIGVAGLGAGGAVAMYLAALDERVAAAVVSHYLDRYLLTSLDEDRCLCNDLPGILRYADMGDVAALIAPRPVLFVNGRTEAGTDEGVRESFALVRHLYYFLEVPRCARLIEPVARGVCFDNQLASGWFRRWLEK